MKDDEIKEKLKLIDGFFNKAWACDLDEVYHAVIDTITNLQQKEELFEKIVYKYDELKQENEMLKQADKNTYETSQEIMAELTRENEILKEKIKYASDKLVGYINAPYVITNEYFEDIIRTIEENTDIQIGTNCMDFMEELEDYKSRCEKALKLAESYELGKYDYSIPPGGIIELKDILNGRSDE